MILVTGASGNNGRELIKLLSSAGEPVRAMVRDQRRGVSVALRGVEVVTADFDDLESICRVLRGIDRAFLVTNSSERAEMQQLNFLNAARAAGVRRIVYLSQLHAAEDSPVRFLRYHAVVENAIARSGMAFTHLRPNLYMQALLGFRATILDQGCFYAPAGHAAVSIVDVRDIAALAAAALMNSWHEGKIHEGKIYDITGPEALTHSEIAAQLAESIGKPVAFVDVPDATMRNTLLGLGIPEWQTEGLLEDYAHYRRGEASGISNSVEDVTRHPARSFRVFANDYRQAFLE